MKLASHTIIAMSAAALFTVSAATIASASNRDDTPLLDAKATITQTTFTADLTPGSSYTASLTLTDSVSATSGTGASQCAITGKDPDATLLTSCVTTLRLPTGDITLSSLSPNKFPTTTKAAILGGTGTFKDLTGEATLTAPDAQTIEFKITKQPTTPPAEPSTPPAEPTNPPAEPGTPPAQPGTTPPVATPATPDTTPAVEPVESPANEPATSETPSLTSPTHH